jgi:hypothetical protein
MKFIIVTLFLGITVNGLSQKKHLRDDKGIPIPKLEFDSKGEIKMTASATSSKTDFDFLIGKWKLSHERLKSRFTNSDEWEEFETTLVDYKILEGMGNEDVGNFFVDGKEYEGRTIRIFERKTRLWRLHWVTSFTGLMDPPVVGSFENGIGHFFTKDTFKGRPIIMMFRWDKRDPEHPIWSQAFSADNGKTWEWNSYNVSNRIK